MVAKLHTILPIEADFNCDNRLIFGDITMKLARDSRLVPKEIYSKKRKTTEDTILQQVLAYAITP